MNFLAHLFLSCEQEELVVGNFIADFIRNKDVPQYSMGIQQGIYLHRKIDSFTDRHPVVLQGVRRLYEKHHKYAPVIIDIFYDYFLANNWSRYHAGELGAFSQSIYRILTDYISIYPPRLQVQAASMIEHNWLVGYKHLEGLADTFQRMKRRVSRPQDLDDVMNSLEKDTELLNIEFNTFFPEVISFVQNECFC